MIEENEIKQIKNLLKNGISIDLISFELKIPIDELTALLEEPKYTNKKTNKYQNIISKSDNNTLKKLELIRKKYNQLCSENTTSAIHIDELSNSHLEIVEHNLKEIEKILNELSLSSDTFQIYKSLNQIIKNTNKIISFPLSIEYLEKLLNLLEYDNLKVFYSRGTIKPLEKLACIRISISRQLSNLVILKLKQTNNLEELHSLYKCVSSQMTSENSFILSQVRDTLSNKIFKLESQKILEKNKFEISPNIASILQDISKGTLDIEIANQLINTEVEERMSKKTKNKFTLTEEQERNQILIQIRNILKERANDFPIKFPKNSVTQLINLFDGNVDLSIKTVITNLINREHFVKAKELLDYFSNIDPKFLNSNTLKDLRTDIMYANFSDLVLQTLNMNNPEEEILYFNMIEKRLASGQIKPGKVYLGKNKNGDKKIYLSSIWDSTQIEK